MAFELTSLKPLFCQRPLGEAADEGADIPERVLPSSLIDLLQGSSRVSIVSCNSQFISMSASVG